MAKQSKFTPDQLKVARDYATREPGFTPPFMAWELGWDLPTAKAVTVELLKMDVIYVVEPPSRPHPAVYAHKIPTHAQEAAGGPRLFIASTDEPKPDLAAERGVVVPHTRARGASGKPGENKERQERGVRIKRARNGT